ncbi:MAG TPA: hypothetical protein VKK81_28705 [Candidatus Binatia bacterium]|nr:hypothetical protein [Candidatus Binatia bacterium]
MIRGVVVSLLTCGYILLGARCGWAQGVDSGMPGAVNAGAAGTISNLGNLNNFGLNPGLVGGGEAIPGAVLVKITGEVQCRDCTLEAMGLEEAPGDLYQFSQENTHMVIKVTHAAPDIAWEMVERHKLFLAPGEDATQLQRLLSESQAGKRVEVTGGVAPEVGVLIPITVKVK